MAAFRVNFAAQASAAALAAALTIAAFSAPARAQFLFFGYRPPQAVNLLPPPEVYRRLAARGYVVVDPLQRNGGVYLADVRDRYGHHRRLVLDAYTGAVLQAFAYGPPRPPANIPEPRGYPAGPAYYASRYPSNALPPNYVPPGLAPEPSLGPEPGRAPYESKAKKPPRRLARRETPPIKLEHPEARIAPEEASPASASGPEPGPGKKTAVANPSSASPGAPAAHNAVEAAVGRGSAPSPAKATVKLGAKPVKGPGYANGVPINPLD